MSELNINSTVIKTDNFVASELDDSLVMMNLETNSYYGLDEIGKRVLEMAEKPVKVSELVNALVSEYDVTPEECEKDVISLLESLHKEGIVAIV